MTDQSSYHAARERVLNTPELRKYQDALLMSDWEQGEAYWRWLATAPVGDVIQRAEDAMDIVIETPEAVEEVEEDI